MLVTPRTERVGNQSCQQQQEYHTSNKGPTKAQQEHNGLQQQQDAINSRDVIYSRDTRTATPVTSERPQLISLREKSQKWLKWRKFFINRRSA
jgi:hypothetical protein